MSLTYIYWTKEGQFETSNFNDINPFKLHSPNEETPALIRSYGMAEWFFEGKIHRLTGAARIGLYRAKEYWLNGLRYEFANWLANHPNEDIYFKSIGINSNEEKALWKLKNL